MYLPSIVASHNAKHKQRIGMSSNKAYFGREVRMPIDHNTELELLDESPSNDWYRNAMRLLQEAAQAVANNNLDKYDARRKEYWNQFVKSKKYKVGDKVLYFHGPRIPARRHDALATRWRGPVTIVSIHHNGLIMKLSNGKTTNIHKLKRYFDRIAKRYFDRIASTETYSDEVMNEENENEIDVSLN